jgi:nucleotide-binding universal stress UspA family protein
MKVLVGIDGSSFSDAALDQVSARSWPAGTEIRVVNAFELPLPATPESWAIPPNYFEELDQSVRTQSEGIIKSAVDKLRSAFGDSVRVTYKSIQGPARAVILDEAEEWQADLIIVGSHGYSAWGRFFLGSVSQAVVSHAKCSVEVVRRKQMAQSAA